MDACAKYLTGSLGLPMALWARYAGQCLIVIVLVSRRPNVWKAKHPYLQVFRSVMLLTATGFFFTSIHRLGIPPATALMMLNPVLITLGGALILKEFLGVQRIIGVLLSLLGALIIIRPGTDVFSATMLLPLIAATCYAAYSLATRYVGRSEDVWTSLLYTGLVGGAMTSLALPFFGKIPNGYELLLMLAIAGIGTLGQLFVIRSFAKAEAGAVAPFAYAGLVYAAIISIVFYGDYPDAWTVAGSLVIAAAGIYVWHRENKAKKIRSAT
jgi:drug/metabolite transporter (DMT)-like permease